MHIHCSTLNWDIRPTGLNSRARGLFPPTVFPDLPFWSSLRSDHMQWQWSEVSWARRALAPGFSQAAPVFSGQFCCAFMPSRSTQPDQACEIAGVPPQYEEIEFADEDELRALSPIATSAATSRAAEVGHAKLFPEAKRTGRGNKVSDRPETLSGPLSKTR
jgi:hypothetical protein